MPETNGVAAVMISASVFGAGRAETHGASTPGRDLIMSLNKKSRLVNSQRKACGHKGEPSETTHVWDAIFAQSPSEMYG